MNAEVAETHRRLVCTPSPTLFVGEGGRVSARTGEGPTAAEASG